MTLAYFSLGSNRGDRAAYLRRGVQLIVGDDAHRLSDVYETDPWGPVAQDDFLNLILEMETSQSPRELLELIRRAPWTLTSSTWMVSPVMTPTSSCRIRAGESGPSCSFPCENFAPIWCPTTMSTRLAARFA